jgi:soluble lytic murein transglycosylase-like protein
MKKILVYRILFFGILVSGFLCCAAHASDDPWSQLRKQYEKKEIKLTREPGKIEKQDPWKLLRAVYLPFSMAEEDKAFADIGAAKNFTRKFHSRLSEYDVIIKKASATFDIPEEVIQAVIMAESGGDKYARAGTTSAKGLMQTIDSTFLMARKGLEKMGIKISKDPFDPESSIMAGAWYLDSMYGKCARDGKLISNSRNHISSWRYPLEYYYAGPVHGAKEKNKIFVFSNGKKRMIDKRAYSKKIQEWAKILAV